MSCEALWRLCLGTCSSVFTEPLQAIMDFKRKKKVKTVVYCLNKLQFELSVKVDLVFFEFRIRLLFVICVVVYSRD